MDDDKSKKDDIYDDNGEIVHLDIATCADKETLIKMLIEFVNVFIPDDIPDASIKNPSMLLIMHKNLHGRVGGFDIIHRATRTVVAGIDATPDSSPVPSDFMKDMEAKLKEIREHKNDFASMFNNDLGEDMSEEEIKERLKHAN